MSLLAALTIKVSAILLLALIGALCLRTSSASARRWVLAVGVVSAVAAPALHVLPILPVRVAPVEPLVSDALRLGPDVPFTEPAVAAGASDDDIGRLAVTIWLVGAVASAGVLLVGLARLRWLRAASSRVKDGPWHRLCADLARSCGLGRGVDLLLGPRPGLVATWGWRRPVVMLPVSASEWPAERMHVVLLHEPRARAPRRLGAADVGRSVALCLVVQPAGVDGPCTAPPRERARGRRPRAGSGRFAGHLRDASRRACEGGSETPADVVAGPGDGASVTPGTEVVRHVEFTHESASDDAPRSFREPERARAGLDRRCRPAGRASVRISFRRIDRQRGGAGAAGGAVKRATRGDRRRGGCRRRGCGGISFRRIDRQRGGAGAAG